MQNISGGSFEPLTPPSPPPPLRATGAAPDVPGLGVMQGGMSSAHPLLPHIPPPPQGGGVGLRTPRSLHAWGHGAIAALAFIGTDSSWGGDGAAVTLPSLCQLHPSFQRGSLSGARR